jgi:putative peptidoglycan lipid II flippase
MGLGWGVILGALLHLLVQLPTLISSGFQWKRILNFGDAALRRIITLMIPRTVGLAALQINFIVINAIASTLVVGSITIFNFANHLQHLPIGFFGASLATAVFPTFTRRALDDRTRFIKNVSSAVRNVTLMLLPVSILMYFLRFWIVDIVLGVGDFGIADVAVTAEVLGMFSFSILAHSLVLLLSKAYFAVQDTRTPVILGVISITVNIILSFQFAYLGVVGLAIAYSLAGNLNALLLLIGLRKIKHG